MANIFYYFRGYCLRNLILILFFIGKPHQNPNNSTDSSTSFFGTDFMKKRESDRYVLRNYYIRGLEKLILFYPNLNILIN